MPNVSKFGRNDLLVEENLLEVNEMKNMQ